MVIKSKLAGYSAGSPTSKTRTSQSPQWLLILKNQSVCFKRLDSAKISCPKIFLISDNLKTVAEEAGKIPTLLKTLALGSNFLSAKCSF
jgi:hypothetical protein